MDAAGAEVAKVAGRRKMVPGKGDDKRAAIIAQQAAREREARAANGPGPLRGSRKRRTSWPASPPHSAPAAGGSRKAEGDE